MGLSLINVDEFHLKVISFNFIHGIYKLFPLCVLQSRSITTRFCCSGLYFLFFVIIISNFFCCVYQRNKIIIPRRHLNRLTILRNSIVAISHHCASKIITIANHIAENAHLSINTNIVTISFALFYIRECRNIKRRRIASARIFQIRRSFCGSKTISIHFSVNGEKFIALLLDKLVKFVNFSTNLCGFIVFYLAIEKVVVRMRGLEEITNSAHNFISF